MITKRLVFSFPVREVLRVMPYYLRLWAHNLFGNVDRGSSAVDEITRQIRAIVPRVQESRSGWLAVSAPGSVLTIGVIGETKEAALSRFREALEAWCRLHENRVKTAT